MNKKFFNMKRIRLFFFIFLLALIFSLEARVFAQHSIINVPSSDILQPGEIMLKQSTDFRPFQPDAFVSLTPSITYGFNNSFNLSVGVGTAISDDTEVEAKISLKKVFYVTGSTRFTIDTRLNPNLRDASTPDNITYAHLSTRIRKTRTKLTAGMYIANSKDFIPDKPGVVLGIEQSTFINNLRLALDWTSRNESYGRIGAGIKYKPAPNWSVTNAVLIPNGDRGNFAFKISITKYIIPKR